jgi:hypothetical protein
MPCSYLGMDVLVTGGIGDWIALDAFLSSYDRASIKKVYYATRAANAIKDLLTDNPYYGLVEHAVIQDTFQPGRNCFFSKAEVLKANPHCRHLTDAVVDLSIMERFRFCHEYHGSSLIEWQLADVSRFNLPEVYCVVCPSSTNDAAFHSARNFDHEDWQTVQKYCDIPVVVLNLEPIEGIHLATNLSGQTSLREAMEIVKGAAAYIGVDSCLCVLASKLVMPLFIKTSKQHFLDWKHVYLAPSSCWGCVGLNIGKHLTTFVSEHLPPSYDSEGRLPELSSTVHDEVAHPQSVGSCT